jgi:hypothetical protein
MEASCCVEQYNLKRGEAQPLGAAYCLQGTLLLLLCQPHPSTLLSRALLQLAQTAEAPHRHPHRKPTAELPPVLQGTSITAELHAISHTAALHSAICITPQHHIAAHHTSLSQLLTDAHTRSLSIKMHALSCTETVRTTIHTVCSTYYVG